LTKVKERAALLALWVLCWGAAWAGGLRMAWAIFRNPAHAWDMARAFDLVGNVATNGTIGEYISTRAGRQQREGRRWACVLCRLLDAVDPGHCERSLQDATKTINTKD
jgi:hypothetical protein